MTGNGVSQSYFAGPSHADVLNQTASEGSWYDCGSLGSMTIWRRRRCKSTLSGVDTNVAKLEGGKERRLGEKMLMMEDDEEKLPSPTFYSGPDPFLVQI